MVDKLLDVNDLTVSVEEIKESASIPRTVPDTYS